ncbi:hypothetical protein EU545_04125 [Candidatus Thorarchaeota archaeon]|nr:MAG: hypothetical protein EU545_04125 [Candidatus Thorarchaeota archaeon]
METREVNKLIAHLSGVFSDILVERGLLESEIFPVNEYICVGFYQTYDRLYDVMSQVWDQISPEELAQQSKKLLSEVHGLSISYLWLYYALARMGVIFNKLDEDPSQEPEERQEQWKFMLENWYRLATNYFNSGKPTIAASGAVNRAMDDETIDWLMSIVEPVSEDQVKKTRRIMGSVDLYAFLDECEARAKIIDHGPYPVNNDEILVFSEYTNLHDGRGDLWMPWSDTEAKLPTSTLGVAMTIRDVDARFNDIGTMTIEPGNYSKHVTGIGAYAKKSGKIVQLGLDELPAYAEAADTAQAELYMKFAEWDKRKLMIAGAEVYWRGFKRFTDRVGITDKVDWKLSSAIIEEHVPFFMEEEADPAFIRMFRLDEDMESDPTFYLLPE